MLALMFFYGIYKKAQLFILFLVLGLVSLTVHASNQEEAHQESVSYPIAQATAEVIFPESDEGSSDDTQSFTSPESIPVTSRTDGDDEMPHYTLQESVQVMTKIIERICHENYVTRIRVKGMAENAKEYWRTSPLSRVLTYFINDSNHRYTKELMHLGMLGACAENMIQDRLGSWQARNRLVGCKRISDTTNDRDLFQWICVNLCTMYQEGGLISATSALLQSCAKDNMRLDVCFDDVLCFRKGDADVFSSQ